MPTKTGDKALGGEWEDISAYKFEIQEDMKMIFEGRSCNIFDAEGNLIEQIGAGKANREVYSGYRCYVLRAKIKFEKRTG